MGHIREGPAVAAMKGEACSCSQALLLMKHSDVSYDLVAWALEHSFAAGYRMEDLKVCAFLRMMVLAVRGRALGS